MILNKHILAILLATLYLFGQFASAHNLVLKPQTLLKNPSEAPAEDNFSYASS